MSHISSGMAMALALAGTAAGQTLPAGFAHLGGRQATAEPFAGRSARYQQIHDATDLYASFRGQAFTASALAFRPHDTAVLTPRTWHVQLTLAHTTRRAANMSTTFADNLGNKATVALPFRKVNSPAAQGKAGPTPPNPIAWVFPFQAPFVVDPSLGNLCWQWQHHSNSAPGPIAMDAVRGSAYWGGPRVLPSVGTGCVPAGRTAPARSDLRILNGYVDAHLLGAKPNAVTFAAIGLRQTTLRIPGWCAPLLVEPLILTRGRTVANGSWYSGSLATSALEIGRYEEIYVQYAWSAPTPSGIGLSDLGVLATPTTGARYVSRVATLVDTTNTRHSDTLGRINRNLGLVVTLR